MKLSFIKPNKRIGIIHAKSDMMGYTIQVNEENNCIFPPEGKVSPYFLSIDEAKSKLRRLSVGKAYMAFDNLHDEVGHDDHDDHTDLMPICLD